MTTTQHDVVSYDRTNPADFAAHVRRALVEQPAVMWYGDVTADEHGVHVARVEGRSLKVASLTVKPSAVGVYVGAFELGDGNYGHASGTFSGDRDARYVAEVAARFVAEVLA